MKIGGIIKRWLSNTLVIIEAILLIISATIVIFARYYYYNTVSMNLRLMDNDLAYTYFLINSGGTDESFAMTARDFIESFSDKDKMAVWIIDRHGTVVAASDGFQVENDIDMPDYNMMKRNSEHRAEWIGRFYSGEKIMALSVELPYQNSDYTGAVRYMISLEEADNQIMTILLTVLIFLLVSTALVFVSGLYFINSIVKPIRDISNTAKQIAAGNLNAHINRYGYNDEITELCDTINYMTDEINTADRLKNDFITTISHELRTPLTAIKGWGETLMQLGESDYATSMRGVEVIIGEADRLNGIVEELLDFSNIQSGRFKLKLEKIDVLAELDETVFTFKDRAVREGIETEYNSPDLPAPMMADPNRIKQVFTNILDNAFKYTEQGGKVTVLSEIVDDGTKLVITFGDTGCGIPPEALPMITEKFFKANTSVRGSGIGLAVSDEIIKLHSGELSFESIVNEGTVVTVTLPIEQIQTDEQ